MFMLTNMLLNRVSECQQLREEHFNNLRSYEAINNQWYYEDEPDRRIELSLLRDAYSELCTDSEHRYNAALIRLAGYVINLFSADDVQVESNASK